MWYNKHMKQLLLKSIAVIVAIMMLPTMVCAGDEEPFNPENLESGQIYVGGVLVDDSNKEDVFNDGTVSYDFSNKTLKLERAEIGNESANLEYGVCANVDNLNIVINDESSIDASEYGIYNSGNINISGDKKLILSGKNASESMGIFAIGNTIVKNTRLVIDGFYHGACNAGDSEKDYYSFKMTGGLINIDSISAGIWADSVEIKEVGKISINTDKYRGIVASGMIDSDDNSGTDGDVVLDSCEVVALYSEDGAPLYSDADTSIINCGNVRISSSGSSAAIETWHGKTEISDCELVKITSSADTGIFNQRTVSMKNSNVSIKAYYDAITCDAFEMENTKLDAIAHYNNDKNEDDGYGINYDEYCNFKSGTAKIAGYPAAMWAPVEDPEMSMAAIVGQDHSLLAGTEYNSYTDLSPVEYKVVKTTWGAEHSDVWYWYPAVGDVKAQSLQLVASEQPDPIAELEKLVAELRDTIKSLETKVSNLTKERDALAARLATPDKPAIKKITTSRSKMTVYWNSVKGATSYQVYYKQKGKSAKTVSVSGKSKTIKKLKKGKHYYIKVRAIKTSGNVVVYGNWSKQYDKKAK